MRKDDARRLDHATLEAMRERAVRGVQNGESPEVVARVIGVNRSAIYGWLAQYRRGGWGALKAKPLFGRPPKLDGAYALLKKQYGDSFAETLCVTNPAAVLTGEALEIPDREIGAEPRKWYQIWR